MISALLSAALIAHLLHLAVHYRSCLLGYTRISTSPSASPFPVSVVIPARNEARDIAATLGSLQAQRGIDVEILVVNDHSSDATAAIVERLAADDPRIRLLNAPDLPHGWLGKPHALAYGAAHAAHQWLLFADADVRFAPQALSAAAGEARRREADLLTLVPGAILTGFWERAIQPVMAAALFYGISFTKVNDPNDRQSVGIGAFMLARRAVYDRVGGHAAIRDRIVDDYALAQTVKRAGGRLWLADGGELIALRMYHGLAEVWRGWSKNLYDGLKLPVWMRIGGRDRYVFENRPLTVLCLFIAFLTATFLLPPAALLWAALSQAGVWATILAATASGLFLVLGGTLCKRLGLARGWVAALPLGAGVTIAIALNSAWQSRVRGGPVWRGRRYHRDPDSSKELETDAS